MIKQIDIANIASYSDSNEMLQELSTFNFVFGANATGKTTIGRIIADEDNYPTCDIKWTNNRKIQTLVYNRDFVDRNFDQSPNLKGVFTLGEESVDLQQKISESKDELDKITKEISTKTTTLEGDDGNGGKRNELTEAQNELERKCWSQKQKHDSQFGTAFTGFRNSATKFTNKILLEQSTNALPLKSLEELKAKAKTIFDQTPSVEQQIQELAPQNIIDHENNPILIKKIIGKDDVDISAMIKRLENSDWIKKGRPFFDNNEGFCPFCQQVAPDDLEKNLNLYFDESYEKDIEIIDNLLSDYKDESETLLNQVKALSENPSRHVDPEKIKQLYETLNATVKSNLQLIKDKQKEPSLVIALNSLSQTIKSIQDHISQANTLISRQNEVVSNLKTERQELTGMVWKYLIDSELKTDLNIYSKKCDGINKAIDSISSKISELKQQKTTKEQEIRDLEKQTTSTRPTIDGINSILKSFGFRSFTLAPDLTDNFYKIQRPDGSDAKSSLSEGEKTFITFLYFFHMLKGSSSESGITEDRVVVFDDPVSSLDSDILFIVSSLIKEIFTEIRNDVGHIKQVFVLTHNVYFFKEVTFNPKRNQTSQEAMNEETFWIVNKPSLYSKIIKYTSNPIKTSYELLWSEVRSPDRTNLTIQNTLRRILENYFKILGGIDPDAICLNFEGKDKFVCKSLFSWVNDGSHYAHDDLYISIDDINVEMYLKVFRTIFVKTGHLAHYKMMMGDDYTETDQSSESDNNCSSTSQPIE